MRRSALPTEISAMARSMAWPVPVRRWCIAAATIAAEAPEPACPCIRRSAVLSGARSSCPLPFIWPEKAYIVMSTAFQSR